MTMRAVNTGQDGSDLADVGWKATTSVDELARLMVDADTAALQQ